MRPPTAFPVVANCAACAMLSPSTRCGRKRVPQPALRAAPLRPRDRTAPPRDWRWRSGATPPAFTSRAQAVEPFVDRERRALGREDRPGARRRTPRRHRASDRPRRADSETPRRPPGTSRTARRPESAASTFPMRRTPARRACPAIALELLRDLGQREVEVRRRGDGRRALRGQRPGPRQQQEHEATAERATTM